MKEIILFPFNGNAREALSTIEDINAAQPAWTVLGFIDDDPLKAGRGCGGKKVLGGRNILSEFPGAFVLAVPGRPGNFRRRKIIIDSLELPDSRFATIIHPTVRKGIGCEVGINTLLMANVVLTVDVTIGSHVVMLPGSVICHDSVVEDYTLIGSNVSVSGGVSIRKNCYVGSGVKIIHEVEVGPESMIGIGSTVIRNVSELKTVVGNPATVIKEER